MCENKSINISNDLDKRYSQLANAIIIQAVNDYRKAMRKLEHNSDNTLAFYEKEEIMRFFKSKWFKELTNIEPDIIIRKLNEEVAK